MQSDISVEITLRFFEAVEVLKRYKRVRGVKTIADECGVHWPNLYRLRRDPRHNTLSSSLLAHLVIHYGISAEWLLTGRGGMM